MKTAPAATRTSESTSVTPSSVLACLSSTFAELVPVTSSNTTACFWTRARRSATLVAVDDDDEAEVTALESAVVPEGSAEEAHPATMRRPMAKNACFM